MKNRFNIIIACFLLTMGAVSSSNAGDGDVGDWQDVVSNAFATADAVVSGTVTGSQNQMATGGGHLYTLEVNRAYKGEPGEELTLRAGGFAYLVKLPVGAEVLVFLRRLGDGARDTSWTLAETAPAQPLVLQLKNQRVQPIRPSVTDVFEDISVADLQDYLAHKN